jgi:hypothetical protein
MTAHGSARSFGLMNPIAFIEAAAAARSAVLGASNAAGSPPAGPNIRLISAAHTGSRSTATRSDPLLKR